MTTPSRRVVAVVAHPDDEIIGVGGTLRKHVKHGDEVHVLILGDGETSRGASEPAVAESQNETAEALKIIGVTRYQRLDLPDQRFDTLPLLDIIQKVSLFVGPIQPQVVYTHHYGDLNLDHRKTYQAVITACRPLDFRAEQILLFETLSSTEMAGYAAKDAFLPNYFINIESELEDKISAMSKYASELRDFPHPRSLESIRLNAGLRGSSVNIRAAEAFELFRRVEM
jgi:LmbE family N-acetylglucosaminyl deacetylase